MGVLDILQDGLENVLDAGSNLLSLGAKVPTGVAIGAAAGTTALATGLIVATGTKKRKARKKKTTRGRSRDRKFRSKQKHEQKYKRKKPYKVYKKKGIIKPGKKTGKKRTGSIHFTKKGQPYKIMANGKARFIKKSSKSRRKR